MICTYCIFNISAVYTNLRKQNKKVMVFKKNKLDTTKILIAFEII